VSDSARVEIGCDRTAGCAASLDAALEVRALRLNLRGPRTRSLRTMLAGGDHRRCNQSSSLDIVRPCQRPSRGVPTFRLVSSSAILIDRQVARLDQDRPQRICISIRFALVLFRLLGGAELNASRPGSGACLVLIEMLPSQRAPRRCAGPSSASYRSNRCGRVAIVWVPMLIASPRGCRYFADASAAPSNYIRAAKAGAVTFVITWITHALRNVIYLNSRG
jgi:hypothetical protein